MYVLCPSQLDEVAASERAVEFRNGPRQDLQLHRLWPHVPQVEVGVFQSLQNENQFVEIHSNTKYMYLKNHLEQRLCDRDVVGVVPAALRRRGQRRRGVSDRQHGVGGAGYGHDAVTAAIGAATHHDADDRSGSLRTLGPSVSC